MEKNKEKKVKKQRYFIEDWLSDDNFKDWLRKDRKDNTKARCILCSKSIELSSSGRSALTDHAKGAKHNEALKNVKIFFAESKKTSSSQPLVSSESRECLIEKQKTLESCVKSEITKAEIIWLLKTDDLSDVFAAMFPDSAIALQFQMACSKSMYKLNHGLAPHFKSLLLETLQMSEIHVYSIDESLNEVTQTSEMDLYIRFWDLNGNRVNVRYFGSSFLGHTTHKDVLTHFNDIVKGLEPPKLYQISMDGPNVNLRFPDEFTSSLTETVLHSLINIGSCNLHIIHGSLKTGEAVTEWKIKKVVNVTGSSVYPLNFCSTR